MKAEQLWASILQEAIQGRLVPQLESEPKVAQIGEASEDVPFLIPEKWKWKKLGDVAEFNSKISQNDEIEASFLPMAAVSAGYENKIDTSEKRLWKNIKSGYSKFADGDIIMAKITPCFQNLKSAICRNLHNGIGAGSTEFHVIRAGSLLNSEYLLFFLKSPYLIKYGVENFKGTAGQQRIGTNDLKKCLIPVPPLEEQQRIVDKLNELRPLVETYGKEQQLVELLEGSFAEKLKNSILQEAIQGKLVPQLESEPVVTQVGAKPHDVPFVVPDKWKWVQLKAVGRVIGGGTPRTNVLEYWDNGDIPWFTPADLGRVTDIYVGTSARKITAKGLANSSAIIMPKNSVLFSSRAPIGYIALAKENCCTNQGCKSFIANDSVILPMWAYWVLKARTPDIVSRASGTTFKEISGRGMGDTWIPLPPIAEQNRIIAKIKELFDITKVLQ